MLKITRSFFTTTTERAILLDKSDKGVFTINLNRPKVRNAISKSFLT